MTIEEMHYDLKSKLNKVDSNQFKNLRIPEIDWYLNEAVEVLIKAVAFPRLRDELGFEVKVRNRDDIRTLVIDNHIIQTQLFSQDDESYFIAFPQDYKYHVSSSGTIAKKNRSCVKKVRTTVIDHDDVHYDTQFHQSSFEWEELNVRFFNKGLRIFTDKTFVVSEICLDYIREPRYCHYAEGYGSGIYTLPSGLSLAGKLDCELPSSSHREVVNIARELVLQSVLQPNYQAKKPQIFENV